MTVQEILNAFQAELARAEHLYPVWPIVGHRGDHVWTAAILAEEAGEVLKSALNWQAHGRDSVEHLRSEAVQVGAMALRFLLNLDAMERQRINEEARQELQKEHNMYQQYSGTMRYNREHDRWELKDDVYPQNEERIIVIADGGHDSATYTSTAADHTLQDYQDGSGVE